jgi:hypothetical protein
MRRILLLCVLAIGLGALMSSNAHAGLFGSKHRAKAAPEASTSHSKKAKKSKRAKSAKGHKSPKAKSAGRAHHASRA